MAKTFMSKTFRPAEAFPPGDFIREELEVRRWSQGDLARIMGRPTQVINEIVNGRKAVTAETAKQLAAAFGSSAQLWLNLESTWQLWKADEPDPKIYARAKEFASR